MFRRIKPERSGFVQPEFGRFEPETAPKPLEPRTGKAGLFRGVTKPYNPSMAADAVFARLRRRPFVPFRLIFSSGTTYDILHPEMLFVSKSGVTVAIYDQDQAPSPDEIPSRESVISYLHIAGTEDLPQRTMRAG